MCSECPVTVIFGDSVHVRRIARLDRIALCSFLWCDAPTIMNAVRRNDISDWMKDNKIMVYTLSRLCS